MKFKNPKTGQEVSGYAQMDCSVECESCPINDLAKEEGYPYCGYYANENEKNLIHAASLLGYYPVETFRDRLKREHPECVGDKYINGCAVSGCKGCPMDYGYEKQEPVECSDMTCEECWDRIIPIEKPEEETEEKKVSKFKEGDIVRLMKEIVEAGGGMYNDLTLTLGAVKALDGKKFEVCATGTDETWRIKTDGIMDGFIIGEDALELVKEDEEEKGMEIKDSGERRVFETGSVRDMASGKGDMVSLPWESLLRLSKHYEAGAKKYNRWNFRKGIPVSSFIDSACRHLAKYQCGCDDEDHLSAAAFNVLGAMLMENTMPEMQDLPSREGKNTFDYFEDKEGKKDE